MRSRIRLRERRAGTKKLLFSVVIPAFNEASCIEACMVSLSKQTLSKHEFEVIVVDNGSVDSTASLASRYESKLPLRVVSISRRSISAARNYGVSLTTGKMIAFLDVDCIPHPTWLADAMKLVADNVIWGAHYKIPPQSSWVGSVWFKYQANEREGPVSFLPGGNLQMTRETFMSLGGFDESVETSEDVELCARARKRGMQVLAYPALAVVHDGTPQTLGHFYRKNRWHGKHVSRVFLANLPSMENLPVMALSMYTLFMFTLAILVPLIGIPYHWSWKILVAPLILTFLPSVLLALRKTAPAALETLLLSVLYAVYSLARSHSLAQPFEKSQRK